jgi:hypothetical protein
MQLTEREHLLAALIALLALTALALPFIPQDAGFHLFADTRRWESVPNAQNVLSNLPFALAGAGGLFLMACGRLLLPNRAFAANCALFFTGLIATAICSGWYHAAPEGRSLVLDRMGMVLAFAGAFGMLAAERVSPRAGWTLGMLALVAGPAAVLWWNATGNLAPYAVVQFGGMGLLLLAALFWREPGETRWGVMLALYALAKALEIYDYEIFAWSGHLVAGHALKHLVAAATALAVLVPLYRNSTTSLRTGQRAEVVTC